MKLVKRKRKIHFEWATERVGFWKAVAFASGGLESRDLPISKEAGTNSISLKPKYLANSSCFPRLSSLERLLSNLPIITHLPEQALL
jgi:hypothetical protein